MQYNKSNFQGGMKLKSFFYYSYREERSGNL